MQFSVITPSRNQSPWLKLCLASVADQGVAVEHIVQDAGSTDGTLEWLPGDTRARSFVEADVGMYDAINRGIRRAGGEAVAYLNCDEQYLPGALRRIAEFFEVHANVDVIFGDIVMVDKDGGYLCHRKVQVPRLCHTWTCHLTTLSCGMFFRRRLFEKGGFHFDTSYRCGGDGEWVVRLLRAGVHMAALGEFTSVFTRTGSNLGREARAREENVRLARSAPRWMQMGKPLWILQHRVKRLLSGAYHQGPFEFQLFTQDSPDVRQVRHVERPVFRQTW